MYTWSNTWINDYESPWSIINKFMLANNVNGKLAANHISNNYARRVDKSWFKSMSSGIVSNYLFNEKSICLNNKSIISLGENKVNNLLKPILNFTSLNYTKEEICTSLFNKELKICPECIKEGKHLLLNQLVFIEKCMIHENKLINSCPHCHEKLIHEIIFRDEVAPYQCPLCNEFLISNNFIGLIDI